MVKPKPKPTKYCGTSFKSRLEARWAVFLDNHFAVDQWAYEPLKFRDRATGWNYTPDFLVKTAAFFFYLEVKPTVPADDYLDVLAAFVPHMDHRFVLGMGGFYEAVPVLWYPSRNEDGTVFWPRKRTKPTGTEPLDKNALFPSPGEALEAVKNHRFDLPDQQPDFRAGNVEDFKRNIDKWVDQQHAEHRKKRAERLTRKRKKRKG